jgi:hypothetical protein
LIFKLEEIGLVFGVGSLIGGAMLLYGASNADAARVLSSAAFASFGAITIFLIVKSKMRWKRHYKPTASASHFSLPMFDLALLPESLSNKGGKTPNAQIVDELAHGVKRLSAARAGSLTAVLGAPVLVCLRKCEADSVYLRSYPS